MPAKERDIPTKNADGYYRKDLLFRGNKYAVRSKTLKGLYTKLAQKKQMLKDTVTCAFQLVFPYFKQKIILLYR